MFLAGCAKVFVSFHLQLLESGAAMVNGLFIWEKLVDN